MRVHFVTMPPPYSAATIGWLRKICLLDSPCFFLLVRNWDVSLLKIINQCTYRITTSTYTGSEFPYYNMAMSSLIESNRLMIKTKFISPSSGRHRNVNYVCIRLFALARRQRKKIFWSNQAATYPPVYHTR